MRLYSKGLFYTCAVETVVPVAPPRPAPVMMNLDITRETCPMTFVRTRIALDQLPDQGVLEVLLREGEPLENVPRSAAELGFDVEAPVPHAEREGVWRVVIRRRG